MILDEEPQKVKMKLVHTKSVGDVEQVKHGHYRISEIGRHTFKTQSLKDQGLGESKK